MLDVGLVWMLCVGSSQYDTGEASKFACRPSPKRHYVAVFAGISFASRAPQGNIARSSPESHALTFIKGSNSWKSVLLLSS